MEAEPSRDRDEEEAGEEVILTARRDAHQQETTQEISKVGKGIY